MNKDGNLHFQCLVNNNNWNWNPEYDYPLDCSSKSFEEEEETHRLFLLSEDEEKLKCGVQLEILKNRRTYHGNNPS